MLLSTSTPSLAGAFLAAAAISPPFFALASSLDVYRRSPGWFNRQSSFLLSEGEGKKHRPSLPALNNDADRSSIHKTAVLEIEQNNYVFGFPFFLTSIAIGTSPQPFCMLIDLDYGGMAVRSVRCEGDCGRNIFSYNSSASTTSHDAEWHVILPAPGHNARGRLFQDDVHLASALLRNATFASVDEFYGENWIFLILEEFCDGMIGLAPPNASAISYDAPDYFSKDPPPCANFLHELTHAKALEHNIMMLSLPRNASSKGHLTLGMDPPHVDYRIPFSHNNTWSALEDSWKVDLSTLKFGSRREGGNALILESESVAAVTLDPAVALYLPAKDVEQIWEHLGARGDPELDDEGGTIACEDMSSMPNMSVTLGGIQIELTWHSYTSKVSEWGSPSEPICLVNIAAAPWPAGIAIIGLRLLREFDLVFDMDNEDLGLIRSVTGGHW